MIMTNNKTVNILGLDLSSRSGWAVLSGDGNALKLVNCGSFKMANGGFLHQRLLYVKSEVAKLVGEFNPRSVIVETIYYHKNVNSFMQLCMIQCAAFMGLRQKSGTIPMLVVHPIKARSLFGIKARKRAEVKGEVLNKMKIMFNFNLDLLEDSSDVADAMLITAAAILDPKMTTEFGT